MFKKLGRNAWIAIVVIALIVIGGGAVSASHTMQVNHQKKVAVNKAKAEKKNTEALANHVAVNGDTVQSVAKKFKENTNYMKRKFNLSKDDQLIVGTKISDQRAAINKKKQDDANAAAAASAAQAAVQSQAETQSGDSSTSHSSTSASNYSASTQNPISQTPTQQTPSQNSTTTNHTTNTQVDAWKGMNTWQAYSNLAG